MKENEELKKDEKDSEIATLKEHRKHENKINTKEHVDKVVKNRKKIIIISAVTIVTILIIAIFCTIFALSTTFSDKIIKGTSIANIDVSGLTTQQAKEKIKKELVDPSNEKILLKYNDYENEVLLNTLKIEYNIDQAVDQAYSKGRSGNIITNNFTTLQSMFSDSNIELPVSYDKDILDSILSEVEKSLPGLVTENEYCIEDDELIITRGKPGIALNKTDLNNLIIEKIRAIANKDHNLTIQIPVVQKDPDKIDIEKIYSEVYSEPKDAYIIEEPFELVLDEDGIDFAITMDEAKKIVSEEKEEYVIPLKITKANKTVNDLGAQAFPETLGYFTTKYDASNKNRSTNLALAAGKINGTVVLPGEVFSYNQVVGKRTIENGYKEAAIYANGGVENGLGGGICQISSTLYNAVLLANLEIVERKNHTYLTTYADPGKDATVVYGSQDFKFKNSRKYPIKIEASVRNGIASMTIKGIKEEVEYDVRIIASKTGTIPYTTQTIYDDTLEEGKEVVKQKGTNGCKSVAYRVLYLNGKEVSRTLLSTDTYSAMKRIVRVGTKKVATPTQPDVNTSTKPAETTPTNPTPTPTPTPTPEPDPEPEPEPTPTEPDSNTSGGTSEELPAD